MLILVAHGSPNPSWRASVERMSQLVGERAGDVPVRLAYMECTPPTLMEIATEAVEAGVTRIRVLPLFLADEGHVERNVKPLVDEVRTAHGTLAIELLPSLGHHRQFREFLVAVARDDNY
ncbi:MAG: CbiX/SirB N-terminal domain-containing protein [Gemmatimonadota bacterium]|nr:MAG: CbiX/SirB N-terminal domain-containing protein [Gemmatimonadota bacterium]